MPDVESELLPCHPALNPGRMRCCRAPVLSVDTVLVSQGSGSQVSGFWSGEDICVGLV